MAPVGEPVTHRMRVRYAEADPQGVAFHGHYVTYIDDAVTELWRAAIGSYDELVRRGADVMVVDLHLTFAAPARADDVLEVRIAVQRLGGKSMTSAVEIRRHEEVLVRATVVHVFVDPATKRPMPIPAWAREALAPFTLTVADAAPA